MELQKILNTGFDRSLVGLELIKGEQGEAHARILLSQALENYFGTLHGGAIATLVDDIGSVAILTADRYERIGVTTDLNVSYLNPAKVGDTVLIEANVLVSGLTLASAEVSLYREENRRLLARGRITKLLGDKVSKSNKKVSP